MATPVPISNTEVKRLSVDGTAWETVWESRTPPDYSSKSPDYLKTDNQGFFIFGDVIIIRVLDEDRQLIGSPEELDLLEQKIMSYTN